jgi:hypothetical protein
MGIGVAAIRCDHIYGRRGTKNGGNRNDIADNTVRSFIHPGPRGSVIILGGVRIGHIRDVPSAIIKSVLKY